MALSLSQLIAAYGDEKVQFQNLDQCMISLDYTAKSGARITFGTEQPICPDTGTEKLGLVVWMDRSDVAAITAKARDEA
jgi:hypothetical protein